MKLESRLFIADLTHLDCAYLDARHGLVGETWRVDAELGGELADNGMLCDFGIVKARLKTALDAQIDHRLLLSAEQQQKLDQCNGQMELVWRDEAGASRYRAPAESFALLDIQSMQVDALTAALQTRMIRELPDNITQLKFTLSPAHDRGPYHYCHGLRQHEGNCQRMAHGHRASLQIHIDGVRNPALEQQWQQRFDRRYIGSAEHLGITGERHRYAYRASQGDFELELPAARSCPIDAEPTIEHITRFMTARIHEELPGRQIECQAFEGIGKGARCSTTHAHADR